MFSSTLAAFTSYLIVHYFTVGASLAHDMSG